MQGEAPVKILFDDRPVPFLQGDLPIQPCVEVLDRPSSPFVPESRESGVYHLPYPNVSRARGKQSLAVSTLTLVVSA